MLESWEIQFITLVLYFSHFFINGSYFNLLYTKLLLPCPQLINILWKLALRKTSGLTKFFSDSTETQSAFNPKIEW